MLDNPDTSSTSRIEREDQTYDPGKDVTMHRIIVRDEPVPGLKVKFSGYKTDLPGAKVPLHALAEHNKIKSNNGSTSSGQYDTLYFTTASGTIYRVHNLEDSSWEIERTSNAIRTMVTEPSVIEVGQEFISPNLVGGKPELHTSPVRDITLVDTNGKPISMGVAYSQEQTDIAERFHKTVHSRGAAMK